MIELWREDRFETVIFGGLVAGLAWAPFWLGGNRIPAWGINGVVFPALVLIYELRLLLTGRPHAIALKRLKTPAALFALVLMWIALQLAAAPTPLAHPIWGMAAEVLEKPVAGAVSVNRGATLLALIRLLTAASVFWLALQLCRHPLRSQLLLRAVSFTVAAYSAYGLILSTFFAGAIPFFDESESAGFVRSTFVNKNSFATYAGLGLIVTVALTLRLLRHDVPASAGAVRHRLGKFIETVGRRAWLALGAGFVILVALLGTTSRGGIAATVFGLFALLALSFWRERQRAGERIEAIVFVSAALVASFVFFGDLFVERLAVSGSNVEETYRLSVYLVTLRSILDAPWLGFGYGTFADVFPMYRDQSISNFVIWDKAHNSFLEIWQGLGLVAGSALIMAVGSIVAKCLNGALKRRQNATPALVATAASLLVGVHALVDFSIQIEAVALTYMALLGAGAAQSESSRLPLSD